MKLGDRVLETPLFWTTYGHSVGRPAWGRVIYIHPERRYYTVEFTNEQTGETFRQSYFFEDRRGTAGEGDDYAIDCDYE